MIGSYTARREGNQLQVALLKGSCKISVFAYLITHHGHEWFKELFGRIGDSPWFRAGDAVSLTLLELGGVRWGKEWHSSDYQGMPCPCPW